MKAYRLLVTFLILLVLFVNHNANKTVIIKAESNSYVSESTNTFLRYKIEKDNNNQIVNQTPIKVDLLIKVAQHEVGNVGGQKYINWYGFNSHQSWCAIFVSWCGDQIGLIDAGTIPKFANTRIGKQWFIDNDKWQDKNTDPEIGSIIFFDFTDLQLVFNRLDGIPDHVGIVSDVKDGRVYTIEGNSNNVCVEKSYALDSPYINGYGRLNIK